MNLLAANGTQPFELPAAGPSLSLGGQLFCEIIRERFQIGESFPDDQIEFGSLVFEGIIGESAHKLSLRRSHDLLADAVKFLNRHERSVSDALWRVGGVAGELAGLISVDQTLVEIAITRRHGGFCEGLQVTVDKRFEILQKFEVFAFGIERSLCDLTLQRLALLYRISPAGVGDPDILVGSRIGNAASKNCPGRGDQGADEGWFKLSKNELLANQADREDSKEKDTKDGKQPHYRKSPKGCILSHCACLVEGWAA
jgi:hypothetical protein